MSGVSIVIPCYNAARFVRAAIDSALAQEGPEVEVIVVDDGSTDASGEILATYGDQIRVLSGPNRGLSSARNLGVNAASFPYILLLDADDMLLPGCAARRLDWLQQDDAIGLVTGNVIFVDEEGYPIEGAIDTKPDLPNGVDMLSSLRHCIGPPTGWAFRREAFLRVGGFDPLLRSTEDVDFRLRIGRHFRVVIDHEPQALYREVQGSMSRDFTLLYDELRKVFRKHRAYGGVPFLTGRLAEWKGMMNALAGAFLRILKESPRPWAIYGSLFRRRPGMAFYFTAWLTRATWNRLLRPLGIGPLASPRRSGA